MRRIVTALVLAFAVCGAGCGATEDTDKGDVLDTDSQLVEGNLLVGQPVKNFCPVTPTQCFRDGGPCGLGLQCLLVNGCWTCH
jgi:hypothetical protein